MCKDIIEHFDSTLEELGDEAAALRSIPNPTAVAACLELAGVDGSVIVSVDQGEIDHMRNRFVLGDCGAVWR